MGSPMILCPYCGSLSPHAKQCNICSGWFDLLSRQRSQNAMGPWFLRDLSKPFQPGCSYATLVRMAQRGKIRPETVLRGPSTRQFWSFARQTPGVAHLLGECHACHKPVEPTSTSCANCRASFVVQDDRQTLGLSPVHLLPGDADAATIARSLGSVPASPPKEQPRPAGLARPEPPVPAPVPIPEPQVVIEEPEWIEEPETRRTPVGSPVGVVVAVLVVLAVMGGAGVWAWQHLARRSETPRNGQPLALAPSPASQEQASVEPGGSDETPPPELSPVEPAGEPDTRVGDAQAQPPARLPPDGGAGRVAYDRILIGIADGTLTEAQFEAELPAVARDRQDQLRQAWQRRVEQVRLGRRGE